MNELTSLRKATPTNSWFKPASYFSAAARLYVTCKAAVHVREVLVVLQLLICKPYSSILHVIVGLGSSGSGVLRARQATAEPVWQWGITTATAADHFPTGRLHRWLGRPIIVAWGNKEGGRMTRWRGCRLKSQKRSVRSTFASGSEVLDRVEIKTIGYSNTKIVQKYF